MGAILSVSDYEKKKEAYVNTMTKVEKYEILARENKALGKALEETLLVFLNQLDDPIKKKEELEQIKEIQKRVKDAGEKEAVEELMKETTSEVGEESEEIEESEETKEETKEEITGETEETEKETTGETKEETEKTTGETKEEAKSLETKIYKPGFLSKEIQLNDDQFKLKQDWDEAVRETQVIKDEKKKLEETMKVNKTILEQKRQRLRNLISSETKGELRTKLEGFTASISRSEEAIQQISRELSELETQLQDELEKPNTDKNNTKRIIDNIEKKTKELSNNKKSLNKLLESRKELTSKDERFSNKFEKLEIEIQGRVTRNEDLEEESRKNEIKRRMNDIDIKLNKSKFLLAIEKDEVKQEQLGEMVSELEDDKTELESLYTLAEEEPVEEVGTEPEETPVEPETPPTEPETTVTTPETTVEPPETTVEPPETPPTEPETTVEPPETTPEALETTVEPPETTPEALETTPEALETTPEALETTPEAPSTEPEAPETDERTELAERLAGGKRRRKRRSYRTMKKIIRNRY